MSGPADHPDGARERNYTGSLADAFVQLGDVGTAGCIYTRPLEAMRRALGDKPANAGFYRDDAALAVVPPPGSSRRPTARWGRRSGRPDPSWTP
jgi:hypothetical protein